MKSRTKRFLSIMLTVMMVFTMIPSIAMAETNIDSQAEANVVAKIGDDGYTSLKAAVDAAQNNDVITIVKDITFGKDDVQSFATYSSGGVSFVPVLGKTITIDLNGKTLYADVKGIDKAVNGFISTDEGGHLTLTDSSADKKGTVEIKSAEGTYVEALIMDGDEAGASSITIEAGNYTIDKMDLEAGDGMIRSESDETITINGGTFTLGNVGQGKNDSPWIINTAKKNERNVIVNGGTFNYDINHQYWAFEAEVSETLALKNNGDGTWTVVDAVCYVDEWIYSGGWWNHKVGYATPEEAEDAVNDELLAAAKEAAAAGEEEAKGIESLNDLIHELKFAAAIDNVRYGTLAEAIDAAESGDTITLLADVTEDVTVDKSVTIDGAKKTYTGNITINGNVDVTVQNTAFVKGKIYHNGNIKGQTGSIAVKSCSFANGEYAIETTHISDVTIEDCTVTGQSLLYARLTTSNITVKNVKIDKGNYVAHLVYGSEAYFENVTATNMPAYGICTQNYGAKTITLKDCSFDVSNGYYALAVRDDRTDAADTFIFEGTNVMSSLYDSQCAKYKLTAGATLEAPEGFDVDTNVDGEKVVYADGIYKSVERDYVAQVGDVQYESLKEAIAACTNGETVKLIKDITYDENDVHDAVGGPTGYGEYANPSIIDIGGTKGATAAENKPSNVNVVLDLNGHTITNNAEAYLFLVMDNAKLTFKDSVGDGKVVTKSEDYPAIWVAGTETTVTIESGEYESNADSVLWSTHGGDLVITGGEFSKTGNAEAPYLIMRNEHDRQNSKYFISGKATVTVTGGTFVGFNPMNMYDDSTTPAKQVDATEEGYVATEIEPGVYGVVNYVEQVKAELLAGNDVTLEHDIVITDYDLVNALKLPSNNNGQYTEEHGNGAIFHVTKPGVELDLNGHSITWDAHDDLYCNKRQVSLFMVTITGDPGETAGLTIKDSVGTGKVDVYGMGTGVYVVGVDAKATINGGTWTNYPCNGCGATNIFMYPSHGGKMYITGGTYEQKVDTPYLLATFGATKETTNNGVGVDYDQTKIEISGGTFVGVNPGKEVKFFDYSSNGNEADPINGCAPGYVPIDNGNGTYGVECGLDGSGTAEDPFRIYDVEDLIFFRDSVNAGETVFNAEGVHVALYDNIDMEDVDWSVNIGDDCNNTFDGIFDGNNKTIKNLTITETAQKADGYICTGLFGAIGGKAVVKNFTIKNVTIDTNKYTGNNVAAVVGFAYNATGSIENVKVKGDIVINAKEVDGVGTIVGYAYGGKLTINNCIVEGNSDSVVDGRAYVGGIIGYAGGKTTVTNCTVEDLTVNANSCCAAGIAGILLKGGVATGNTVEEATIKAAHENWQNSAAIVVGAITGPITVADTTYDDVNTDLLVGCVHADKPTTPVKKVQAVIGDVYYPTFEEAYEVAKAGDTITLLAPVVVEANETLTLDKAVTINYTSNVPGEDMFTNKGTMVVNGATLVYVNTDTTANNVTVSTISCEPGSTLEVKSGVVKNDSANNSAAGIYAYAIDLVTNGSLGDVTATISGGEVISTNYMAIRQFVNGEACKNTLTVTGGTIVGATRGINIQLKNNMAYTTITGGTIEGGDYSLCALTTSENLSVTGGTFKGEVWYSGTEGFIAGGTFNKALDAAYCAEGYEPYDNGDGTYTVIENPMYGKVAQIGETTYPTLAAAITAAKAGDTITLLTDVTENVTVNKNVTIDGADKTYTGQIIATNRAEITIKNVNFDGKGFKGYAIETRGAYYLTVEDCTAKNYGYGFIQVASGTVLTTVKNVTISDMAYGVKVDYSNAVILENVTTDVTAAGVLNSNYGEKTITIKNSDINILGTWTRNDNLKTTYVFEGENSIDEFIVDAAIDNFKLADVNSTLTAPKDITVTTDVEGSEVEYKDGKYIVVDAVRVAQIGDNQYKTLAAAITAAKAGDTITLLTDVTENVTVNKNVTIDGADKTYTGQIIATNRAEITIKNVNFDGKGFKGYAIETRGAYYLTVEDCTAKNYGYGFIQVASGTVLTTVKNVTISDMAYGVKVDYSNAVILENVTTDVTAAGVLNSNYGEKTITIKNSDINILGTWTRNDNLKTTYVFEGENSIDEFIVDAAIDNFKLADVNSTLTAPKEITVTTEAEGYKVAFENGVYKLVEKTYEAQIDNVKYETLQEAIDAAKDGETVKLLDNIELGWNDAVKTADDLPVLVKVEGKSINLDMNGKSIKVDHQSTTDRIYAVVYVADEASLNVAGEGTIDVATNEETPKVAYMFWKRGTNGTLTIENGTYHMNNSEDSMVYTNGSEIVTVNGGTFTLDAVGDRVNGFPCIFNANGNNNNHVIVTGGTYNYDISNQYWRHEVQYPETHCVVDNGDGTWTVTKAVAYIKEATAGYNYNVGYPTLAEAFAAAKSGETVYVAVDHTDTQAATVVPAGVTLDLNGHYVKAANVLAFGNVIDTAKVTGGIKISNKTTEAFVQLQPENAGYLPIYDTRVGEYKFFEYEFVNFGIIADETNSNIVRVATRILFTNPEGYDVLANTDASLTVTVDLYWTGLPEGKVIEYTLKNDTVRNFATQAGGQAAANETITKAMALRITGVNQLENGDEITAKVHLDTVSGVGKAHSKSVFNIVK